MSKVSEPAPAVPPSAVSMQSGDAQRNRRDAMDAENRAKEGALNPVTFQ